MAGRTVTEAVDTDLSAWMARMRAATEAVIAAYRERAPFDHGTLPDPVMVKQALGRFADVLAAIEAGRADGKVAAADATRVGDYGLNLLMDLGGWAGALQLDGIRAELQSLAAGLGLRVVRWRGQLETLEPIVDGLAPVANRTHDPQSLEALARVILEVMDGVAPHIRHDLEAFNPGRPWRVLNLNLGIVATRPHNTEIMERAFAELTGNLPDDAPQFFREGMRQMQALDYPKHVRQVMQKYFQRWSSTKLH